MSRLVYLDCASGASGDMVLGALLDLGLPLDTLRAELAKLPLQGYRLEARKVDCRGLQATKLDVVIEPGPAPHRGLRDIQALLDASGLEGDVKRRASALFARLAEVEAEVHGTTPDRVHFHEVGAVDSIVDIVGSVIGLAWLRPDRVVASPLNVGTGSVRMAHGTFAVPAPATARLTRRVPVYGAGDGELLTPTGALLVTGHASEYGPLPLMRTEAIGHGAGSRQTGERPNVLRLFVGEAPGSAAAGDRVVVLETEIDDLAPALLAPVLEKLLAAGAKDAFFTPIQMKKGRPGILLTVLADPGLRTTIEDLLLSETTTLGVRWQEWPRTVLERDAVTVSTPYGAINVKRGLRAGRVVNAQPEVEDCRRAAAAHAVPLKEVWAAAVAAYRSGARD